jgi:hypothetical protein
VVPQIGGKVPPECTIPRTINDDLGVPQCLVVEPDHASDEDAVEALVVRSKMPRPNQLLAHHDWSDNEIPRIRRLEEGVSHLIPALVEFELRSAMDFAQELTNNFLRSCSFNKVVEKNHRSHEKRRRPLGNLEARIAALIDENQHGTTP